MGQDDLKPEARSVRLGGEAASDDVEGHAARKAAAIDPEGASRKLAASDDDDVEGHAARKAAAIDPEAASRKLAASDDDDVEGHRRQV